MSIKSKSERIIRFLSDSPLITFVILATVFGLTSVFTQPPMVVNDEIAHTARAYEISNGVLLTKSIGNGQVGGAIPNSFIEMNAMYNFNATNKKINKAYIHSKISDVNNIHINSDSRSVLGYSNTALYSPISYVLQATTIGLARILNLSVLTTLYLIRMTVLCGFILMVALAIRIAPTKKWFFAIIGLLPMCVQEAASTSIDALIVGFCILFIACYIYIYSNRRYIATFGKHRVNLLLLIFCAVTFVSLSKIVYYPLFLILLLLPKEAFARGTSRARWLALTLLVPFLLVTSWNIAVSARGVHQANRLAVNSVGIYPNDTSDNIKNLVYPSYTAKLLYHTYVSDLNSEHAIPNFITQGFFGLFTSYYIKPPVWYSLSVYFVLLLAYCMSEKKRIIFARRLHLLLILLMGVSFAGITLSMLFYTTSKGAHFVNGVQGRYFIPLLPFIVIFSGLARPILQTTNNLRASILIIGITTANLSFMQLLILQSYWI